MCDALCFCMCKPAMPCLFAHGAKGSVCLHMGPQGPRSWCVSPLEAGQTGGPPAGTVLAEDTHVDALLQLQTSCLAGLDLGRCCSSKPEDKQHILREVRARVCICVRAFFSGGQAVRACKGVSSACVRACVRAPTHKPHVWACWVH